ncbi:MAG: hypothetical protein V1744_08665 [Candidatus Altiarchaeota archaeon]
MELQSKAQAAMEYLMTYGWAILVVMVVGIAMWQLGIFNMGGTSITATGFAKIKPQLAGTGLDHSGVFTAVFTNGLGTTLSMTTGAAIYLEGNPASVCANVEYTPRKNIQKGINFVLMASGGACPTGNPGEVYSLVVSMPYYVEVGGTVTKHTESGRIRGPFE